jgi:zinc finger SWIM domain-containing protein 3
MRKTFAAFPELLFIDATYKLNDLGMPVYVMLVEDGNGESEIVCIWIVNQEDKQTITKMMESFKKHNGNWGKVECIISDKDMTERQVLKEQLPQADLQICLFHVLKAMRREVTAAKLGISQAERQLALEILTKIVDSKTEASYQELKKQLEDSIRLF